MKDRPMMQEYPNRRDFLWRLTKVCASLAGVGGLAYWLHDKTGPSRFRVETALTLPRFSVPATEKRLAVVTGRDRSRTVQRAIELVGGMGAFVHPGDRVLLKINAAFAMPPMLGATTHPDLVRQVARLCFEAGAKSVLVTDNPINDPVGCFRLTGIAEAVESCGATLVLPQSGLFQPVTVASARLIRNWPVLVGPFDGVTKLIGMAPVKDHHRSGASMTMKNWYGLLGGRRNLFHQEIHTIIMELAMLVSPTLVILDGTDTMMTNGPTGGTLNDLKQTNTMIVSTDQVAADALGATLLGKTAGDLPFIAKAQGAGLGVSDYSLLHPQSDHVG
jgi:uncharacterized protein (DUF362 family)